MSAAVGCLLVPGWRLVAGPDFRAASDDVAGVTPNARLEDICGPVETHHGPARMDGLI